MFSYDAILCWNNDDFWDDFAKDEQHWGVLKRLVKEMSLLRYKLKFAPRNFSS